MSTNLIDFDSIGLRTTVGIVGLAALLIIGMSAAFAGGVAADTGSDANVTISTGAMPGDTIEERSEQRQALAGVDSSTNDAVTTISTGAMPGDTLEERSHQRQLIAGVAGEPADSGAVTSISTGAMPGETLEERSEQRQLLAGASS